MNKNLRNSIALVVTPLAIAFAIVACGGGKIDSTLVGKWVGEPVTENGEISRTEMEFRSDGTGNFSRTFAMTTDIEKTKIYTERFEAKFSTKEGKLSPEGTPRQFTKPHTLLAVIKLGQSKPGGIDKWTVGNEQEVTGGSTSTSSIPYEIKGDTLTIDGTSFKRAK